MMLSAPDETKKEHPCKNRPKKTFDLDAYRQAMAQAIGTGPETQVFWNAFNFAVEAHQGQYRKSGAPYIMHPCSVALILAMELDVHTPDILAAALLHDTIEDVEWVTPGLLNEKFGKDVTAIVEGCTKVANFKGSRQMQRKLAHRKIFSGAAAKLEVMLVKLADRLHNMRTLASMAADRRQRISEETLDIYAPMATILGLFGIKREMYSLALAYRFPNQCKPIKRRIEELKNAPKSREIVALVQETLAQKGIQATVELRVKDLWAYYDARNRILVQEIENPQELIILVENRDACYMALGVLNALYPPTPRSIRDFIANPKPTGYQGLHARPNIDGVQYLFKIRTEEMSRRARCGLVQAWSRGARDGNHFFEQVQEMFDIMASDESLSYREMIAAGSRKEIYTYTPKGDLVCLPARSTVLDFAFRVHSDIGLTCCGAMVGLRKVEPGHRLSDGDVVRILRQRKPATFENELLEQCQTPKARYEILKTFRARRKEISCQIGLSVLRQELQRYGIPREVLEKGDVKSMLACFALNDINELYLALGEGRVHLQDLIQEVKRRLYAGPVQAPPEGILNKVELSLFDPMVMKVSSCCRPSPLDKGVIGLLSERGLSLHRKECPQLGKINFQREDAVEVRWLLPKTAVRKPQKIVFLRIESASLFALMATFPKEAEVGELVHLGNDVETRGDWELSFKAATLRALQKVLLHFEHSGLTYEFELEA